MIHLKVHPATLTVLGASLALANAADPRTVEGSWLDTLPAEQWCGTFERYQEFSGDFRGDGLRGGCPTAGSCDDPLMRDAYLPGESDEFKTIRIFYHLFCLEDGTDCTGDVAEAAAQTDTLNETFAPYRVRFVHEVDVINNTNFHDFGGGEETNMKNRHAVDPVHNLNVYVVVTSGYSFGTFPWDSRARTNQGGIVLHQGHFGPNGTILTHEVGHCIGLWHTHHGVSEVTECGACWERADGLNGDTTGDFCSDTAATPVNYQCNRPNGTDPCSDTGWGRTNFRNYMGYAPPSCYTHFSDQQSGRFHCWIEDRLSTWLVPPCLGDLNNDGIIDTLDLAAVLSAYGQAGTALPADLTNDGIVDVADLALILSLFSTTCE